MKTRSVVLAVRLCFGCYWSFGQMPKLVVPVGHNRLVEQVTFSPDGKSIVRTSEFDHVKVWNAIRVNILFTLENTRSHSFLSKVNFRRLGGRLWSGNSLKIR